MPDADLDVSVDFGETVARTPQLTSRPKSGSASLVLPDYLSPVHNATFAPGIGAQRPGERKAVRVLTVYVLHVLNFDSNPFVLWTAAIATGAGVDDAPPPSAPGPSSRVATSVVVKKQNRAKQPSSSRTAAEERKEKRAHKTRKPPRDEIDDIFA